jgi:hypothetical protein
VGEEKMTAEIAIVNRQAIALAADSAVTIGKDRVWKLSNKLFSLGPRHDIGVMIYNNGEFCGYPWEVIIKTFRENIQTKDYATVTDCADDFLSFVGGKTFVPDDVTKNINLAMFVDLIENLKNGVSKPKSKLALRADLSRKCDEFIADFEGAAKLQKPPSIVKFKETYMGNIKKFSEEILEVVVTAALLKKITDFCYSFYSHSIMTDYFTGIVFAGYGKSQFFPEVREFAIDGKDDLQTRSWIMRDINANKSDAHKTVIVPFGQTDIFHLFMEGIEPDHVNFIASTLEQVLDEKSTDIVKNYVTKASDRTVESASQKRQNKKIVETFMKEFKNYRANSVVRQIIDVLRALPKEEMAEMAKALVELTSLRRKMDSPIESVGGPVDIAIISKGDGFIWMERKHYFELEKNRDFLYRKASKRGQLHVSN